jgi:hypothetical protein
MLVQLLYCCGVLQHVPTHSHGMYVELCWPVGGATLVASYHPNLPYLPEGLLQTDRQQRACGRQSANCDLQPAGCFKVLHMGCSLGLEQDMFCTCSPGKLAALHLAAVLSTRET